MSYLCLYHSYSSSSHSSNEVKHVDIALSTHSVKHGIQCNEGSSSTNSSTMTNTGNFSDLVSSIKNALIDLLAIAKTVAVSPLEISKDKVRGVLT